MITMRIVNFKILLVLLLGPCMPLASWSQTFTVTGQVADVANQQALPGATVQMTSLKDSTNRKYAAADIDGNFTVKDLHTAYYKMVVTSVGYQPYTQYVRVKSNDITIAPILLKQAIQVLEGVEVTGKVPPAQQKGDTVQFNAAAYKTNPDANAEDLVAKMPGIVVTEGRVEAQGEAVQQVLVDGREFFSNDPTLALRTIPAQVIQKIEVFDQQSDQARFSGFDDGNTTKTINIVTKPSMRDGTFGRAYAGYGTDNTYTAGGNVNYFNNDQRLTLLGLGNNVNEVNFSNEDLLGVSSSSSRRGPRGVGGGGSRGGGGLRNMIFGSDPTSNFITDAQSGISEAQSVGLNYNDAVGDALKVHVSYFFNRTDNLTNEVVNQQTFLTDGASQFYEGTSLNGSVNHNHRLTSRIEYSINRANSIIFTPRLSLQHNEAASLTEGATSTQTGLLVNRSATDYQSDATAYNFSGGLLLRHRFAGFGHTLSLLLSSQNSGDAGEAYQASDNEFLLAGQQDSLNQFTDTDGQNHTYSANLIYTYPLRRNMLLQLLHNTSVTSVDSDQRTYDYTFASETVNELDTALSNTFDSRYVTHRPLAGLRTGSTRPRSHPI